VTEPDPTQTRADALASEELLPLVYDELRRLAAARLSHEKPGQTLQATALVHEAYMRLSGDDEVRWDNKGHFFGAAALAMRRILVERARRVGRIKHGGGRDRVPLTGVQVEADNESFDFVGLDEALRRMEQQDQRMSQVVMLRFFAGLSIEDTAGVLGVSPNTVKREWACARAWLHDELHRDAAAEH